MTQIDTITSLQNNYIKLLKKLSIKKYRLEHQKFTVENLKIIKDALNDGYDFDILFVSASFISRNLESFKFIQENSKAQYCIIDEKLFSHFSQLDTAAGIIAIYQIPQAKQMTEASVIYLNNISDPGNLGTILRTALAFNFNNIVLDKSCVDIYNAKTIAAAKNSFFRLHILEDKDASWIRETKLPIYTTSSYGETDLDSFQADDKFCLVLGNESHGVSQEIEALAKKKIKINISDNIESLNVSVASAILLYKLQNN